MKDRQRRFDLYMKGQTPEGDVKGSVASPQISSPSQSEGEPVIKPQNTNPSESLETPETAHQPGFTINSISITNVKWDYWFVTTTFI